MLQVLELRLLMVVVYLLKEYKDEIMEKEWYKSMTFWGCTGFAIFASDGACP